MSAATPAGAVPAGHASDWELPGWEHAYSGKVRDLYVPSPGAGSSTTS